MKLAAVANKANKKRESVIMQAKGAISKTARPGFAESRR
jgi:hypothetical protein